MKALKAIDKDINDATRHLTELQGHQDIFNTKGTMPTEFDSIMALNVEIQNVTNSIDKFCRNRLAAKESHFQANRHRVHCTVSKKTGKNRNERIVNLATCNGSMKSFIQCDHDCFKAKFEEDGCALIDQNPALWNDETKEFDQIRFEETFEAHFEKCNRGNVHHPLCLHDFFAQFKKNIQFVMEEKYQITHPAHH